MWKNKIICRDSTECSINLDGRDSYDPDGQSLNYIWDFWNWEISNKSNPKSIKFKPWKYKIKLKIIDDLWVYNESYFFVDVYDNKLWIIYNYEDFLWLKLKWVLANSIWKDDLEYIDLVNTWNKIVNLKWISIDDKLKSWSKAYLIEDDLFLLPKKTKRLYKTQTWLSLWNTNDEVNLLVWDKLIDSISWNFVVPEGFLLDHSNTISNLIEVTVIRVIDGDTIEIEFDSWFKRKLRLIWVDTPETKHPKKKIEDFWKDAYDFTKNHLEWKKVYIDIQNSFDKYGRLLWYVYLDKKKMFNEILIKDWYARAYLRFSFKYSEKFKKLFCISI